MELTTSQVVPLALLYAADDHRIEGRTRFQKLAFLTKERLVSKGYELYEFVEYDYGPFSKELLDDLEMFEYHDLVEISESVTFGGKLRYDYAMTSEGKRSFEENLDQEVVEAVFTEAKGVVDEYNSWSLRKLLNFIYDEYPRFRERSEYY